MRNIAITFQSWSQKTNFLKKLKLCTSFGKQIKPVQNGNSKTLILNCNKSEFSVSPFIKSTTFKLNDSHASNEKKLKDNHEKISHLLGFQALSKNIKSSLKYCSIPAVATTISDEKEISERIVENIPEPPVLPDVTLEAVEKLNSLGEPTFQSLGLGGWTPIGLVQQVLEFIHVSCGLPWWGTIAVGTVIVRTLMFPLVIISQRNAAKMNNYLPQMQILQLKMTEARQTGNNLDVARYSQELMTFMKEKGLNPFKNMVVPLAQMPLFVSFFMGLRQMANVPVESLRSGGILWFTDLTVPDQYYGLPIITSLTLWITIEVGADAARLSSQNLHLMKYVMRALPVIILPFTVNFPGAILCYWVSTNFISLLQVGFLRIPSIRQYFKIEQLLTHKSENLPIKNKGFVGGLKDSWTNIKVTKEIEDRQRFDEIQFRRAGKGPVLKTYKYDPTKTIIQESAVDSKKR